MTKDEEKALVDFFQATHRSFSGDNSEYARAYKRCASGAIKAVRAVSVGKQYDYAEEVWK